MGRGPEDGQVFIKKTAPAAKCFLISLSLTPCSSRNFFRDLSYVQLSHVITTIERMILELEFADLEFRS